MEFQRNGGLLIAIEGIEGSGKSNYAKKLINHVAYIARNKDILWTREPWKKSEIEKAVIRDTCSTLERNQKLAELYAQDRAIHGEFLIKPNLENGVIVISEGYSLFTYAYFMTRGIDMEDLNKMHSKRGILTPDLTIFIDIEADDAMEKLIQYRHEKIKDERELLASRVLAEQYRQLASGEHEQFGKILRLDANKESEENKAEVRSAFTDIYNDYTFRKKNS